MAVLVLAKKCKPDFSLRYIVKNVYLCILKQPIKMMKKIAILFAVVAFATVANAQIVVGLQGGYYQQGYTNEMFDTVYPGGLLPGRMTSTELTSSTATWLAGVQIGYQITPKIYAGLSAGYLSLSSERNLLRDSILIDSRAHSDYVGMWMPIDNHLFLWERTGWQVSPMVRYEFLKYGNMHFNVMLQGTVFSLGYTTLRESYSKPFDGGEMEDFDPILDSISNFTWSVSLRPTLVYEFSRHLSAELSLDFLSVGYVSNTRKYDGSSYDEYIVNSIAYTHVTPPHKETTGTLYAGLNTLMETLRWESPMLRLGFNYKF